MRRRSFLGGLLGIPLLAKAEINAEEPKIETLESDVFQTTVDRIEAGSWVYIDPPLNGTLRSDIYAKIQIKNSDFSGGADSMVLSSSESGLYWAHMPYITTTTRSFITQDGVHIVNDTGSDWVDIEVLITRLR